MDKLNNVGPIRLNRLLNHTAEDPSLQEKKIAEEESIIDSKDVINETTSSRLKDLCLRNKIKAIQRIKKEVGIETQAAIEPATIVTTAIVAYFISRHAHTLVKLLTEKVMKPLGNYWNDDLVSSIEAERIRAIERLATGPLKNPLGVVRDVEEVLRDILVGSCRGVLGEDLSKTTKTVSGLFAALEGLYQRKEVEIQLDKSMYHGWKRHSEFKSGLFQFTGTVQIIAENLLPWRWGEMSRELKEFHETTSLSKEKNWHEKDNACEVFIHLLEHSEDFPAFKDDDGSKESMRRILVKNWKVPIKYYKIPDTRRSKSYREGIYGTILATLLEAPDFLAKIKTSGDPLFLRTPIANVPTSLQSKVLELRKSLVKALAHERGLFNTNRTLYSDVAIGRILDILDQATAIPKDEWDEEAKKKKLQDEENKKRFVEFKDWSHDIFQMDEKDASLCFESLNQPQKDAVSKDNEEKVVLKDLLTTDTFSSEADLNERFGKLLELANLGSRKEGEKLTHKCSEKGLFFFKYLNMLIERKVTFEKNSNPPSIFKNHLNKENKEKLLVACRLIVHDRISFPQTGRSYDFFVDPLTTSPASVPGQALALYHKLTKCFNDQEGYVDIFGLKDQVLKNAAMNLSPSGQKDKRYTGGFIFSGPPGTGKSSFAEALASQLAVPLIKLTSSMITPKVVGTKITFEGEEITLHDFFNIAKANVPCVLLLDDAEKFLVPREADEGCARKPAPEEENLTTAFSPELQNIRDEKGRSEVILIMTTNQPPAVDPTQLSNPRYLAMVRNQLYKWVSSTAVRPQRIDYEVFDFHKLCNVHQGEAFARRFLEPYIESGKIKTDKPVDYSELGKVVMDYTPAAIEKAFGSVANSTTEQVTIEQMLSELKMQKSRLDSLADFELMRKLEGRVDTLVEDEKKRLDSELDYYSMALVVKELTPKQIRKALEEYTPEVLTQENILAAFERVRKES